MKKIFNDKYSIFILKKDNIDEHSYLHEKGTIIYGSRGNITNENNIVTIRTLMGEISYTGINHVDCIYKRFSIRAFLRIKYLEREDRKIEKDKEKYKRFKSFGIRIKGTNKRVRVKPELVDSERIYFPPVKSLPQDCVIQNGDKIKIIYIDKDGKKYTGGASSGYEIIDIN
jgi:hypothetical protein